MKKALFAAVLAGAALAAGAAQAELIRRDEAGVVTYVVATPAAWAEARDVAPGAAAWSETLIPSLAARLNVDAPARNGPGRTAGPVSGSVLFAYAVEGGHAFCPFGPKASERVQCYRDLDNDGDFDGSYVTIPLDNSYYLKVGRLTRLSAVRALPYERLEGEARPQIEAEMKFVGWRGNTARFALVSHNETVGEYDCNPDPAGACAVLGLTLNVTRGESGAARVQVTGGEAERQLRLDFT